MRSMSPRLVCWIVAIILGAFLFGWVKSTRRNYWLLRDCQEGVAVVTKESWAGHNSRREAGLSAEASWVQRAGELSRGAGKLATLLGFVLFIAIYGCIRLLRRNF